MSGFLEGVDRDQVTLFPDRLEDWIDEDHLVRVVDLFVDQLDLVNLGFVRAAHAWTGRPGYHPAVLLKLFIHGYLNRVPSSRRLEREAGRNVEVMWLLGRLAPDHKTIADFRRDNGGAIRKTCAQFVELCRRVGTLKGECVAIDGSKFKAVNNRDKTHIIVTHDVTNKGFDRGQLSPMAMAAKGALGRDKLHALADKGYFSGAEIARLRQGGHHGDHAAPGNLGQSQERHARRGSGSHRGTGPEAMAS